MHLAAECGLVGGGVDDLPLAWKRTKLRSSTVPIRQALLLSGTGEPLISQPGEPQHGG